MQFRFLIGCIGFFLPVVLVLLSGIVTQGSYWIQPSISHYYYSVANFVFLSSLILLGLFLILYRGKYEDKEENYLSTFAGVCAFAIAIFPTSSDGFKNDFYLLQCDYKSYFKIIHFTAAALLFICFVWFCLRIFQKSDNIYTTPKSIKKKKKRNIIYKTCGYFIMISILMIAILSFPLEKFSLKNIPDYTFYFECIALWSFGIAWLVKGSELFSKKKNKFISIIR